MKELSFTYTKIKDISSAESMLRLGTHALKVISDHYVLTSCIGVSNRHDCPIHELLYRDIQKSKDLRIHTIYQDFLESYGDDLCDMIFVKDENFIRDKVSRTITFAMDKVYNCDNLAIRVPDSDFQNSMADVIYGAIQRDFQIIGGTREGVYRLINCNKK